MRLRAPPTGPPIVLAGRPGVDQHAGPGVADRERCRSCRCRSSSPGRGSGVASLISTPLRVAGDQVAGRGHRAADRVAGDPDSTSTPSPVFANAAVPEALVPIQLPATRLEVDETTLTPAPELPEITLPAPAAVPPMVTPVDEAMSTPASLGSAIAPAKLGPIRFPSTKMLLLLSISTLEMTFWSRGSGRRSASRYRPRVPTPAP